MDLNINIKLTCDDYMVRLADAVVRSLDAIDGAVAPMVKAPETKPTTAPALAAQPQQAAPKAAEPQQTRALFPPAPAAQPAAAQPAQPAPAPQTAAKPEKVDLPELRTLTKDWLRANSAHTKELRSWLGQQGLSRISDISTAAQADSLKQMIKGA